MLAAIILYISSVSLHLEKTDQWGFFSNLSFSMSIKKKKKKERVSEDKKNGAFKTKYAVVYLCLIPMQYGVKSDSRHWHDSACLDKNWEPLQSDVTVIK